MKTRQTLIALTAALALHTTTALAALITTNTALAPGDPTYDGADLIVSNCTLTVDGVHNFASLRLIDNAVLTHSSAPAGETNNRLDLTIAGAMTIDATSRVDVNAKGYGSAAGPGAGNNAFSDASGGGHGGPGGNAFGAGGASYGDLLAPTMWGSGGGSGANNSGAIRVRPRIVTYIYFLERWARRLSWRETARAFDTSWECVYRSVEWFVQWGLAHRKLEGVQSIGVDEIHWGKSKPSRINRLFEVIVL